MGGEEKPRSDNNPDPEGDLGRPHRLSVARGGDAAEPSEVGGVNGQDAGVVGGV